MVDIGGSHIKGAVLDARARVRGERLKIDTPDDLAPERLVSAIESLASTVEPFDRVSVGVNGLVWQGVVYSIPISFNSAFCRLPLASRLERRLGKPVRLVNDAEMHGFGMIRGSGVELVLTFGTGLGSALFIDGDLGPHLQFAPSPRAKLIPGGDYGDRVLKRIGRKRWSRRVATLIENCRLLTNFDRLYIGGGNADELKLDLPEDIVLCDNRAAMAGGVKMWRAVDGRVRR